MEAIALTEQEYLLDKQARSEYAYASHFENGLVTVCKADEWYEVESSIYWCENEKWSVIDEKG